MKEKSKRIIEVILIFVISFIVILIVFFGVNFGVKQFKSMTGNSISSNAGGVLTNSVDWIFITIISAIIIVVFIEIITNKHIVKVKWDLNY
jgi:hypothetical protein